MEKTSIRTELVNREQRRVLSVINRIRKHALRDKLTTLPKTKDPFKSSIPKYIRIVKDKMIVPICFGERLTKSLRMKHKIICEGQKIEFTLPRAVEVFRENHRMGKYRNF